MLSCYTITMLPVGAPAPSHAVESSESPSTRDDVDVTLIRWMLALSSPDRLAALQGFVDSVFELTHDSPAAEVQRSA